MPPRTYTNPKPMTASAREAQMAFYCELCNKQYSRQNEYDDHISSYAHHHAQNRQNMMELERAMANNTRKRRITEEDRAMRPIETPATQNKPALSGSSGGRFLSIDQKQGSVRKEAKILGHNVHPEKLESGLKLPTDAKETYRYANLESLANGSPAQDPDFYPKRRKTPYNPMKRVDLREYMNERPSPLQKDLASANNINLDGAQDFVETPQKTPETDATISPTKLKSDLPATLPSPTKTNGSHRIKELSKWFNLTASQGSQTTNDDSRNPRLIGLLEPDLGVIAVTDGK